MKVHAIGAIAAALALTATTASSSSAVDDPRRIVNGSVATDNPGAVSLFVTDQFGLYGNPNRSLAWCTATLLDADSVLTARSCVDDSGLPLNYLRIGSMRLGGGTTHGASDVVSHGSADLAVITLKKPVSNPNTATLADSAPAVGDTTTVYGWGRTESPAEGMPSKLKKSSSPVTSLSGQDRYGGTAIVTDGGDGSAWMGDEGAPQVNDAGEQVGVYSQGGYDSPQNFASVSDHLDWIKDEAGL
ncbi:S1 family peptidase [Demetria terragena]|uniref:S1 family peptidase n=1 Tax=Demetria terragena TaxID=63959 RepID=UPI00037A1A4C|nr:trypsin-like serine protease [Demetria terragena]